MYKFAATDKPEGIRENIKLAHELKHNFAFVCAVCFFVCFVNYYFLKVNNSSFTGKSEL